MTTAAEGAANRPPRAAAPVRWLHAAGRRIATAWAQQQELAERQELLLRPWEEEFLHWSFDGESWQLHGTELPPRGRHVGTTRSGWCPALLGAARRPVVTASEPGTSGKAPC